MPSRLDRQRAIVRYLLSVGAAGGGAQQTGIEESRLVRAGVVLLLTARETPDGHKQAWEARQADLDTVAVRVRDLDDEAAAEAYTRTHDQDLNNLQPQFGD